MEKEAILSRQIQDSLSGIEVVKFFTAEERETNRIHFYLDELKKTNIKSNVIFNFSSELLSLLGAMGGLIVLWYSGLDIIRGNFTIGSYIAFSAYLAKLYGPTQILATIGLHFQRAITALKRITEIMDLTSEEENERGIKLKKLNGEIEFKNVNFSYDTKQVLTNISFKIRQKEKILIIGPNGSGKSTIIKLILGLYKPQKGKIIIDNKEIAKISLSSLREGTSIVSQNTFLFNDTIRNNILYSRPEAKEKEVEEAARLAGAYEFIQNLENGFETVVGETGKILSGGEKQKIALARAILKNSSIIIFDEATAHLDSESQKRIEKLIKDKFNDKTCFIISHRVWNIPEIDKIIILRKGKIFNA
jgi:ABC-type multidrug transport system fused ATPase/permease subunit